MEEKSDEKFSSSCKHGCCQANRTSTIEGVVDVSQSVSTSSWSAEIESKIRKGSLVILVRAQTTKFDNFNRIIVGVSYMGVADL